jgi:putative Mg2+ transporter-C (MgtC) family protein
MDSTLAPTEIMVRLIAAVATGAVLGVTRDLEGKPTGMRTLGLVALSAASLTLSTFYLRDFFQRPDAESRVIQGLIQGLLTGIGFLGAGAVLNRASAGRVTGLTTAANVMVVAGLGVAYGLGAWWVALITAALAFILLVPLHPLERALERFSGKTKEPDKP